ncbi:MAG: hypothetical protein IPL61_30945 [Myxococcales bacterium]|nr:hypothetical protein [Myxococcales bacterium]
MSVIARAALALVPLTACVLVADDAVDAPPADPLAGYRALAAELAAQRTEIAPAGAYTLLPAADRLYWIDHQGVASLHARVDTTGARLDYAIDLGDPDGVAVLVSSALIVTSVPRGDEMVVRAWRADAPAAAVGELVVPAPADERRTWPIALDGDAVWLARDLGAGPVLSRWRPTAAAPGPVEVLALADTQPTLARVDAVGVALGLAVVVEAGRVWRVELATGAATWVRATTEAVGAISIDPSGLLVETAAALLWLPARATTPVDVGAIIARHAPVVPFFTTGHHLDGAAALRKGAGRVPRAGRRVPPRPRHRRARAAGAGAGRPGAADRLPPADLARHRRDPRARADEHLGRDRRDRADLPHRRRWAVTSAACALALALATTGCVLLRPTAPTPPTAAERRTAYLAAHPDRPAQIRAAISDGDVVAGMTEADVRASLGPAQRTAISTDSRYQLELGYRTPRRSTVHHFEGGQAWDDEVETGATVCVVFLVADLVADARCTIEWYPRPVPVRP